LLGVSLGAGSFGIPPGVGYDRIGPRFFPSVVAAGLALLGVWLAVSALRAARTSPRHKERAVATDSDTLRACIPTDWRALGFLGAALLLSLALLERGGFVIAASALFWTAARGFGSRRPLRDAVIAVTLAVVVFLAFTRGLGLTLPLGIFERLL
jgi:putative tricarboxylic transport membrane protein